MEASASVRLPSPRSIWAGLSPEERTALLLPWWDLEESEAQALRAGLVRAAARQFHFREQSLRNRDVAIARVARLPGLTDHLANGVAKAYLLNGRTDLLSAFLDAMGIAHEGGVISSSPNVQLQPHSKALAALEAIRRKFPEADIRLYLAALSATDQSWVDASALLAALGEGEATPAVVAAPPPLDDDGEHLTTLDEVIIRLVVDTVAEVEGALDREKLDNMIEELIHLNSSRHRSFYHRGFFHALQRRALDADWPAINPDRERWYLAGAVVGFARAKEWKQIVDVYRAGGLRELGGSDSALARGTNQFIVAALFQCDQAASVREFLAPEVAGPTGCLPTLFAQAQNLLQGGRFAEARGILDLLASVPPDDLTQVGMDTIARRRARCMLWQGEFANAIAILEQLRGRPVLEFRADVLADLALAQGGFRGLVEVVVPEDRSSQIELRDNLQRRAALFVEAAESHGRRGHADFCLGVMHLISEHFSEAAAHLEAAQALFARDSAVYSRLGLPARSAFYLGVALLGALDGARAEFALGLLCGALEAGFRPPGSLCGLAALGLDAQDPQGHEHYVEKFVSQVSGALGDVGPDAIVEAVKTPCRPLVAWLLQRGEQAERGVNQRMQDLLRVVERSAQAGFVDLQAEALDGLQALARQYPRSDGAVEFLELIEGDGGAKYGPAWDAEDAAWAAVDVRERRGELLRAAAILDGQFHAVLRDGTYGADERAVDIADRIESYGVDWDTSCLRRALPQRSVASAQPERRPVRIVVVGGDERQAGMEESVRGRVRSADPAIDVTFRCTDWSSNWGRQYDQMKSELARSDGVVVMRLIRTNLGRAIRKGHRGWTGCSGHSVASIADAVVLAARRARELAAPQDKARGAGA